LQKLVDKGIVGYNKAYQFMAEQLLRQGGAAMEVKDTLDLRCFPVVVKTDCKNIYRVYPLKQKVVAQLYKIAGEYKEIKKIYIFGSSVTSKCHIDSDVDICIDADVSDGMRIFEIERQIGNICDWNCDIVIYSNLGNRLKETIKKEGVVIYEQSFGES